MPISSLTWILPLLAIWPLLQLLKFAGVARTVMGLRLSPVRIEAFPYAELPAHFAELAKIDVEELTALGFTPRFAVRHWEVHMATLPRLRVECANADGTIWAIVAKHPSQTLHAGTRIILRSTLENGDELVTSSHEAERLLPPSPRTKSEVIEGASVAQLMARHGERLAGVRAAGIVPLASTPEEAVAREIQLSNDVLAAFARSGNAATDAQGRLYWRFLPGLRTAWQLKAQAVRRARGMKAALLSGTTKPRRVKISEESQLQFDWETYQFLAAVRKGQIPWTGKMLLMLGSLVLFCLALGWTMSPATVLMIVAVLVFHEGGHLLGMRLFGFHDTQLLFLPFLGGVAVGRDAVILKPWQNLVMLFLGPLPGLFIGLGLAMFWPEPVGWVHQLAEILIFINAFNLLPFLPLDGGQVMDTVFVGRFPFIKVVFIAVSAGALILISLGLSGGTLLLALGAFMLFRLPTEWRMASLLRQLRREAAPSPDEEGTVRRVIRALRAPKWSKTPMMQRIALSASLQAKLRQPPPDWRAILLGIVLYTSPLWVGLGVLTLTTSIRSHRSRREVERQEAVAGLPTDRPVRVPPAAPDAQNAAVPLKAAVELIAKANPGEEGSARPAAVTEADSAETARVIALLHDAAGRLEFEPAAVWPDAIRRPNDYSTAMEFLTTQAGNLRKLHDANGALALCLDGLRLDRKYQAFPADWNLMYHVNRTYEVWGVVEEVLADEPGADPGLVAQLAEEDDAASALNYGREAILDQAQVNRKRMEAYAANGGSLGRQGYLIRALIWLTSIGGPAAAAAPGSVQQEVWAQQILDGIAQGRWPALADLDPQKGGFQATMIRALANDAGRLRLANTALAICWQGRTTGHLPASFGEIRCPWWERVPHEPLSGQPLQWQETHRVGILSYPAGHAVSADDRFDREDLFSAPTWRLPVRN